MPKNVYFILPNENSLSLWSTLFLDGKVQFSTSKHGKFGRQSTISTKPLLILTKRRLAAIFVLVLKIRFISMKSVKYFWCQHVDKNEIHRILWKFDGEQLKIDRQSYERDTFQSFFPNKHKYPVDWFWSRFFLSYFG